MASPCCFHLPDSPQVQATAHAMEAEVRRIEQKYSRYNDGSVLSAINRSAGQATAVDGETAWLLNYARVCFEQSGGLFDISSGILRQAWDFRSAHIPADTELQPLLQRIGFGQLECDGHTLQMPAGMELDFGGIGKEYAADCAAAVARQAGIHSGIIDLGGDLHILGPKITASGEQEPWLLGVRHPRDPQNAIARLPVYSGGMATSGDYERFFEHNGRRYCHLLNPVSGQPVSYWASATILAPSCLLAGTLASIAMLKEASASDWLADQNLHALLIRPDLSLTPFVPQA